MLMMIRSPMAVSALFRCVESECKYQIRSASVSADSKFLNRSVIRSDEMIVCKIINAATLTNTVTITWVTTKKTVIF